LKKKESIQILMKKTFKLSWQLRKLTFTVRMLSLNIATTCRQSWQCTYL